MNCPVCREPLVVVERDGVELDWCPWCRGFWFDSGELELLAERYEHVASFQLAGLPTVEVAEEARKCPRCDARMDKVSLGDAARIVLDRCPGGHGLWLDHGELSAALETMPGDAARGTAQVVNFLGETFHAAARSGGGSNDAPG